MNIGTVKILDWSFKNGATSVVFVLVQNLAGEVCAYVAGPDPILSEIAQVSIAANWGSRLNADQAAAFFPAFKVLIDEKYKRD